MSQEEDSRPLKIEISQDKLVDILMHAATREDIAKLDNKMQQEIEKLDNKMQQEFGSVRQEIAAMRQEFGAVRQEIKKSEDKMDLRYQNLEKKFDRFFWFVIASVLIPIAFNIFRYH